MRPFYRIHPSLLLTMSWLISAHFIQYLRLLSPPVAVTCVVSRLGLPRRRTQTKRARPLPHSHQCPALGPRACPCYVHEAMRQAKALSEVILLMAEIPASVRPFACGASIMALRKLNGTLRPLAIGETLWRLTSEIAVNLNSEHASAILQPLQVGFKTGDGCEATVHVTRQWFHAHLSDPNRVTVCADIRNALNSVHRSAVLSAIRTHFPSSVPWVDCTGDESVASQTIASTRRRSKRTSWGLFCLQFIITQLSRRPAASPRFPTLVCFLSRWFAATIV